MAIHSRHISGETHQLRTVMASLYIQCTKTLLIYQKRRLGIARILSGHDITVQLFFMEFLHTI